MHALDGNAIAGPMFEHYGAEMTAVWGTCAYCGTRFQIAEFVVYPRGPGVVARCRTCGNVDMVLVRIRGELRIDSSSFRMDHPPGAK